MTPADNPAIFDADAAFAQILALAKAGRSAEASALMIDALRRASDGLATGRPKEALAIYERAARVVHPSLQLLHDLAQCRFMTGDLSGALDAYAHILRQHPTDGLTHRNVRAIIQGHVPRAEDRIRIIKDLLRSTPLCEAGPVRLRIETSSTCNLRCRHCPTGTRQAGPDRQILAPDLFEILLQKLTRLPVLGHCVLYLGGEPLLNPNLPDLARRLKAQTTIHHLVLNTNAMLVTPQVATALASAGIDEIRVSIDGRSPGENDNLRRGSDYRTVKANAHLLRQTLPETRILIVNTVIKDHRDDSETPSTPGFLREDFPGFPIETTYAMKWPGFDPAAAGFSLCRRPADGFCLTPFMEMSVRADGDIVLCCHDILSKEVLGNVRTDSLMDIWRGTRYAALRLAMLDRRTDDLPDVCRQCIQYDDLSLLSR